ncbi:MAG: hypothetical protein IIB04_04165 [Acidobacteria bacterium]|nr:hypothetical protein [Acidobacteriota bacterium]
MSSSLSSAGAAVTALRDAGDYVGSPLYRVIPEHGAGWVALALFAIWVLLLRWRDTRGTRSAILTGYRALPTDRRFLAWLLASTGAIHIGLALGDTFDIYAVGFAFDGVLLFVIARRLVLGRRWRKWAAIVLVGSILGFVVSSLAGNAPDQTSLVTKLVEIAALGVVLSPSRPGRFRQLGGSVALIAMLVLTSVGSWAGAFNAGAGGHHLGEVPEPGVLLPLGEDREPTEAEQAAADELYAATVANAAKYEDVARADADGYDVNAMSGREFHAGNERYKDDGLILDPTRPENLIYAEGPDGPVLVGVLYEMSQIGVPGPAVGGPLTVWHAHDNFCFAVTPPAIAGLVSPLGMCPVVSIAIPITGEMLHIWTLPGAPEPFGDLDEQWLDAYLGNL